MQNSTATAVLTAPHTLAAEEAQGDPFDFDRADVDAVKVASASLRERWAGRPWLTMLAVLGDALPAADAAELTGDDLAAVGDARRDLLRLWGRKAAARLDWLGCVALTPEPGCAAGGPAPAEGGAR